MLFSNHSKIFLVTASITLVVLLTACATSSGDYQHRTFSHKQIRDRGLVVLGVVPFGDQESAMRTTKRSKILSKAIGRHRGEFPLVSAESAKKELSENYPLIMAAYQKQGALGRKELELIRQSKILSRYALIARIDSNRRDHPPKTYKEQFDGSGKLREDRHDVIVSSRRTLSVTAKVYDLEFGKVVWQARRVPSPVNTATYVVYKGDKFAHALQIATMNHLTNGSLKHLPPPFPPLESVFEEAVDQVVRALPSDSQKP